jgi:hypothetical protein
MKLLFYLEIGLYGLIMRLFSFLFWFMVETWNVTCMYSQFQASLTPKCCVSLSAFYNSTIVPCPQCSCQCQGLSGGKCVK